MKLSLRHIADPFKVHIWILILVISNQAHPMWKTVLYLCPEDQFDLIMLIILIWVNYRLGHLTVPDRRRVYLS